MDLQAQFEKLLLFGAHDRASLDNAPCCSSCGRRLSVEEAEEGVCQDHKDPC